MNLTSRSSTRAWLSFPLVALDAVVASAQQLPQFPVGAHLVQVTVSVTDDRGQPVNDLRPTDFVVTDEGVPQPLVFFQAPLPTAGGTPSTLEGSADPVSIREGTTAPVSGLSNSGLVGRHHLLIVLEPMRVDVRQRALRAIRRFLEEKHADAYAIAILDGSRMAQRFVADPQHTLRTLAVIKRRAYAPARIAPLNDWSGAAEMALRELSHIPGRKSIVVFLDLDVATAHALSASAAIRANAALYLVDARGLVGVVPFGDAENPGVGKVGGAEIGAQVAADLMARTSILGQQAGVLRSTAESTGGQAVVNDNNLGVIFRRVEEDSRGTYVLGYELTPAMADGRFHKVGVKLARRRLAVRTADGYFAPLR